MNRNYTHAVNTVLLNVFAYAALHRCLNLLKGDFQKDLSRKYGLKALKYLNIE